MPHCKEQASVIVEQRKKDYANYNWKQYTAKLQAGSPMFFGCEICNSPIIVPENFLSRPKLCGVCTTLRQEGWL